MLEVSRWVLRDSASVLNLCPGYIRMHNNVQPSGLDHLPVKDIMAQQ